MIARAVAQVTDRLNNKMDKERKEMFDRIDSLANSLRSSKPQPAQPTLRCPCSFPFVLSSL
eukprot:767770-Hanusia_phi.AAC.5